MENKIIINGVEYTNLSEAKNIIIKMEKDNIRKRFFEFLPTLKEIKNDCLRADKTCFDCYFHDDLNGCLISHGDPSTWDLNSLIIRFENR